MAQLLLFPDPRPLVERLGADFFRQAPQTPGVYLMRDAADLVLYVGKAKNLRKRLASYRVANPDRMPRRHLRLVRAVTRIELQECPDEQAALARESDLLQTLKPRFNRAGTWKGPQRLLGWRTTEATLELSVLPDPEPGWELLGPTPGAPHLRAALARLIWCAKHAHAGLASLPPGWFVGRMGNSAAIAVAQPAELTVVTQRLRLFCEGDCDPLLSWLTEALALEKNPFGADALKTDLELLENFAHRGLVRTTPDTKTL